jgi:stage II sporulation protein P
MNSNLPIPYESAEMPYMRPHKNEKKRVRRRYGGLILVILLLTGVICASRFLPDGLRGFFGGLWGDGADSGDSTGETTTESPNTDGTTEKPEETHDIYEWNCELPMGAVPILPRDCSAYEHLIYAENPTDAVLEAVMPAFPKKGTGEISVLIVNTHSFEAYAEEGALYYTDAGFATNGDESMRVSAVAKALCEALSQYGIGAVFVDCMAESSFGSYQNAQRLVELALEKHPGTVLVIDIHRAVMTDETGALLRPITEIAGEITAQARILLGAGAGFERNAAVALALYDKLNLEYERLLMPLSVSEGAHLQKLSVPVLMLEIGSCGNYISEACRAATLLAQGIAREMLS